MKITPSHPDFEADFKAFLDGELTFWRRAQVRRHLQSCPQCREELRIMQTIENELKTESSAPLHADLRAKILESAPTEAPKVAPRAPLRVRSQLGFGAASAAVLAALLFYPVYQGFREYGRGVENARRSSSQSNLNQIGLGNQPYLQDYGEKSPASPSAGAVSAAAPSNSPLRGASRRATVGGDSRVNGAFSDGHIKNRISGDDNSIYLDNSINQRQIHKEGSMTVAVDNAEAGGLAVENIVKNAGGFVASQSLSTGAGELRSAVLDCRVPVEKFEFITGKIGALGQVRAKSLNGEDITARVAAAAARKTALTREFSVASAQLKQKEASAKKRDAQSLYYARLEVRQLRVQAAQSRAALQNLQRFSALSSLYVTVQDKPKPVAAAGSTTGLGGTARVAWSSFLVSAQLPLQLLIWIAAYAPLWLPALILWRKFGRKWLNA